MTDSQWFRIRSFLNTGYSLCLGHAGRGHLFVKALCWMAYTGAHWHRWPAAYGKGNSFYRRSADGCDRGIWPRLMAYMQAGPDRYAVWWNSPVVRTHA